MPDFLKHALQYSRHRQVLRVCLPLVISLSATTVMEFTDRVFLANYSIDAISAALPAGITSYLFLAFFGGAAGYAAVFIAQYTGKGTPQQIGAVLWQGIYFTFAAGGILWVLAAVGTKPIFLLAGHPETVRRLEEVYFSILCKGSVLHLTMTVLSTFFTGRGLTRPVMIITFIGVFCNIPLDYALIFGRWGMPRLGIEGAALATVCAWGINASLLASMTFTRNNDLRFGVFSRYRFDSRIFFRLMRFGIPGALQFTIDILAFTLFILLVGRIGKAELAATNIVLSINALAFMPSMGLSQGMSVLVGQALGRKKPSLAGYYVVSGCQLLIAYILVIDLLFLLAPEWVLAPFMASDHGEATQQIFFYGRSLLQIVSAYLFFDAMYMVLSGALKGAGDTRFMMLAIGLASIFCLVLPVYLGIEYCHITVITAWLWVLFFVTVLFLIAFGRYRQGSWRKMLVIEDPPQG